MARFMFPAPNLERISAANAAPEWQASSLGWRSQVREVACPLEGLVRRSEVQTDNYIKDRHRVPGKKYNQQ
jgi:hypothetical protein